MGRCDRMPKHTRFTVSGRIVQLSIDTARVDYRGDLQPGTAAFAVGGQ